MKHLCFSMPLSSEEMEEPLPKKLKIDRSYMRLEEPNKLLERLCCVDKKPSSKPLSLPVISWSFNQCMGKLQANDNKNLTTNLKQDTLLKPHENVNLQSILVKNVSFTETWTFASTDDTTIKNGSSSEFNKSHNSLVTKPESWMLPAKKREKSTQSDNISQENELSALNAVFYNILPGNLIAKIESLPTDRPEFLSNEYGTGYHQVYEMLRSNEQYMPKSFSYDENNNSQIQYRRSPSSSFIKAGKSNFKSLAYEYIRVINMNSSIFSYKKQTSENNYFKRNKTFQHIYKPYSRNLKAINPKVVKCAALGLFLQGMGIYNVRTSTETNGPTIFSHIIVQRKISNENYTKECVIFSRDTRKDFTFSVAANKEQMAKLKHFNNPILPDNNFPISMLWKENLCSPKQMYSLTENFQKCECLASFPTFFEKSSCKQTGIQTVVMAACMQKEKGNTFQENNILKQYNQHGTGSFNNIINFKNQSKSFQNYTGICKKPLMNKNRFNSKDGQDTFCGIVDKQAHFSCSDTFQKICLSAEEAEEIYFVGNIIFHAEKNKEYNKIHTAIDKRMSHCGSFPSNHSCASSKHSLLEQEFKGEMSHYPKDLSWYLQNEINYVTFPYLNSDKIFNFFSNIHQYFISVTSHELIDQSIVSVNRWHSKTAIHIKREKLSDSSGRRAEQVENENFQEDILLSSIHNSDDIPVKQNVDMIENAVIVLSNIRKINHSQNLTIPYFKDKSTILSSHMRQQHDATEENFSLNSELVNKKYEFEMKNHFDMVLKELQMFHEISKENENSFACEKRGEINKENGNTFPCLEKYTIEEDPLVPSHCEMLDEDPKIFCENKANVSFSIMDITMTTVQQNKNEHCSLMDVVLTMPGEQEVPHEFSVSSTSDEELFYSPSEEHCSSCCKQSLSWKPAFVPHSYTEERSFSLESERGKCFLDGVIKVQPLKTCHRPLRIGLSRRAKPRQLHPYLK
uniref:RAD51 interacting motif domain-containing protein n=1 Tax=Anolis carolinensis TaxID=28377 RepID=A0A803TFA0_ANOCA|nr:PREDICTED: RAD51-associated protein 2 [Anolis carolinensis]|eukprot:XP_008115501.1 PREDICTED: RAD51-associated protein 2 [Anolis carolinensis]